MLYEVITVREASTASPRRAALATISVEMRPEVTSSLPRSSIRLNSASPAMRSRVLWRPMSSACSSSFSPSPSAAEFV